MGPSSPVRLQGFVWGSSTRSLTAESPEESQSTAFDTILLADLVFNHSQHEALLNSCEQLLTTHDPAEQSTPPTVLCFYAHHRPTAELIKKDESFLDKAKQRGWIVDGLVENPDAGVRQHSILSSMSPPRAHCFCNSWHFPRIRATSQLELLSRDGLFEEQHCRRTDPSSTQRSIFAQISTSRP